MKNLVLSAIIVATLAAGAAKAEPIDFTFTVSGTAENWAYDFSVTNNLGYIWQIYFFGVALPNASSPVDTLGMSTGQIPHWSNYFYNSSTVDFNVNWLNNSSYQGVAPGATGHFLVSDTSVSALDEIHWHAFAYTGNSNDVYTGGPYYGPKYNPGFEGINATILPQNPPAVPEAETYAMLLSGLAVVGAFARRVRKQGGKT